jgi:poly-gamma-glutamate capsule biosynthesis protein CapA/YwtB (metallophosphatase superfamily)/outer membrane protein assembly factor BamB
MAALGAQARADLPFSLHLDWTYTAWGTFWDAALVDLADPMVALASFDRMVYVLNADGTLRWRHYMAAPVYQVEAMRWRPDRFGVAAGDDAGRVTLHDERGRVLWWRSLGSRVTVLRAMDVDGDGLDELLAGGWDGRLTCLDAVGQVRWQIDLGAALSALDGLDGNDRLWVGTAAGTLLEVRPDGAVVARRAFDAPVTALDVGVGVIGLQDGRLVADGWEASLGSGPLAWYQVGSTLAAGAVSGELTLLDGEGELLWQVAMPAPVQAVLLSDLDADGSLEIVVGSDAGLLWVVDLDGQILGELDFQRPVWGLQTLPGAVLVRAGGMAARLTRAEDGAASATVEPWGAPPRLLPLGVGGLPASMARQPDEAVLLFLGDVMLGRTAEAYVARHGSEYLWQGLDCLLDDADLLVVNLENPLTTQGRPLDKPFILRAHPDIGTTLQAAGVDVASVANNHALDFGPAGLAETLQALSRWGVVPVGGGESRATAEQPAITMVAGVRVAILAYAAPRWRGSEDMPDTPLVAWATPERVRAGVRAVRDSADVVAVVIHAGREYDPRPTADLRAAARAALGAGADLVVGHHSHIVGQIERNPGGRLVAYSLGNAVFDMGPIEMAHHGAALRVHVTRQGVSQVELWPFWIEGVRPRLLLGAGWQPQVEILWPARSRRGLE